MNRILKTLLVCGFIAGAVYTARGQAVVVQGEDSAGTGGNYSSLNLAGSIAGSNVSGTNTGDVSLSTAANNILSLTGQQIGLDTQAANTFPGGPASGSAAAPAYRALVAADLPGMGSFLSSSTIRYAATWGTNTNPGTETQPYGPDMNAILPLVNTLGGNVVVIMAPGSYNYAYSATALLTTPGTKCFLQGAPGLVTIRFDGDSASALDVTPVNIAGAHGVHFDGVWEVPSSSLVNGPALIRDSGFAAIGFSPVFSECRFDVYQVDQDEVSQIYDCTFSGATTNETVLQGQKINLEAAEISGLVYTPRASITVENAGGTISATGTASGIVIRQTSENDPVTIAARRIENNVVTGAQNINTSAFESVQYNRLISTGTNGASFLNTLTGVHAIVSNNLMSVADVGNAYPWALDSNDSPLSFTFSGNQIVYTGVWAELTDGTPAMFIRYDNDFPVYIHSNTFGSEENPCPVIPVLDGFWNATVDPGQPTDDRFMSIQGNTFYVTYANTANPPDDPATAIGYLMSRSDTGTPTYEIHGNTVFFDSSATQSTDRLHAALFEIRGAGSGGNNGSPNPVTGNTFLRASDNTVYATFPAGTITNGGKSLVYVRNSPIFSEQATMLTPVVDIDGVVYTSTNQDNHIRGSSSTALNFTSIGITSGDTALSIQSSVGTATRKPASSGALTVTGAGSFTGALSASNLSGTNTGDANAFSSVVSQSGTATAATPGAALTINGAGIATTAVSGSTLTVTATEVDGSTTNEIQNIFQTVTGNSGATTANTSTDSLGILGGGINVSSVSGDNVTITGTEADTLDTVTGRGATTSNAITTGELTAPSIQASSTFGMSIQDSTGTERANFGAGNSDIATLPRVAATRLQTQNASEADTATRLAILNAAGTTTASVTGSGVLYAADGTVSLPGVSFQGDTNTGIYRSGADQIEVVTNATSRIQVSANGVIANTTLRPDSNNTRDNGTTSERWANANSVNGNFSNDVTISDDLFLTANSSDIRAVAASGAASMYLSAAPTDGTSNAIYDFGRLVTTTGNWSVLFRAHDGTNTSNLAIDNASTNKRPRIYPSVANTGFLGVSSLPFGEIFVAEINITEGTNRRMGAATLAAGTVTVSTTEVTATSRIFLTSQVDGGTVGFLRVSARTAGTSFTITSSSVLDTSTVAWLIINPN